MQTKDRIEKLGMVETLIEVYVDILNDPKDGHQLSEAVYVLEKLQALRLKIIKQIGRAK